MAFIIGMRDICVIPTLGCLQLDISGQLLGWRKGKIFAAGKFENSYEMIFVSLVLLCTPTHYLLPQESQNLSDVESQ